MYALGCAGSASVLGQVKSLASRAEDKNCRLQHDSPRCFMPAVAALQSRIKYRTGDLTAGSGKKNMSYSYTVVYTRMTRAPA